METLGTIRHLLTERRDRLTRIEVPTEAIGLDDDGQLRVNGWTEVPGGYFIACRV